MTASSFSRTILLNDGLLLGMLARLGVNPLYLNLLRWGMVEACVGRRDRKAQMEWYRSPLLAMVLRRGVHGRMGYK